MVASREGIRRRVPVMQQDAADSWRLAGPRGEVHAMDSGPAMSAFGRHEGTRHELAVTGCGQGGSAFVVASGRGYP